MNRLTLAQRRLSRFGETVRHPATIAGAAILVLFTLAAAAHPLLVGTVWPPSVYDPVHGFDPAVAHPSGPSAPHVLGTDPLGRDVASMVTFTLRSALTIAIVTAVVTGLVALVIGAVAAYWRGPVDTVLSNLSDAMLLLPAPIAMIAFGIARPGIFGPVAFGLAYGLLAGAGAAAVTVRSYGLTVMAKPFIDAARIAGGGATHIIARHLAPHLAPLAAIQTMLAVTGAIVASGFVEYLTPGQTERLGLGSVVYYGLTYQQVLGGGIAWSALAAGALTISAICAAFYLLSVGLRETLDPTTRNPLTSR